jgi:hypothetical protein
VREQHAPRIAQPLVKRDPASVVSAVKSGRCRQAAVP